MVARRLKGEQRLTVRVMDQSLGRRHKKQDKESKASSSRRGLRGLGPEIFVWHNLRNSLFRWGDRGDERLWVVVSFVSTSFKTFLSMSERSFKGVSWVQ